MVTAGCDFHCTSFGQQSDDEDGICDFIGTVGDSLEIVPGVHVRGLCGVICRVAASRFQRWAVPVDDLVVGDIVAYRGRASLVCGDEWLGHFEPTVVRPANHCSARYLCCLM